MRHKAENSVSKNKILLEAFKLFASKPFEKVTFADLEKATGLSRGAILYHIQTKENLFEMVLENLIFKRSTIVSNDNIVGLWNHIEDFIQERIKEQEDFSSSSIANILDTYGECILTGYITGGKACALYTGLSRNGSSSTSKETGMEKSIDASFSWKKNSVNGDFQFGKGNFNYESSEYNMEQLYTKMWIYGGDPVGLSMNSAENLVNINFDLAPWVASLSDSKKHTIIDITDNGLYPLSAFVIEENFKKRLDATTSNLLEKYPSFVEPHIEIMRVFERYNSSNEALYDVVAVLFTRQGDRIVLRSGNASTASDVELRQNENATVFSQKALNIKTQKQNFYELRISSNSVTRLNPKIGNPLCIDLPKVNEANMYTYTNPRTGIQYIYDTENKIAFSHYTDDLDGDWILDDYGIRSWVESLPTKSISMATLANSYRIIGL